MDAYRPEGDRYQVLVGGRGGLTGYFASRPGYGQCTSGIYDTRLRPYFGDVAELGYVLDVAAVPVERAVSASWNAPLLDLRLSDGEVDACPVPSTIMREGLEGAFAVMAAEKAAKPKWSGLDSVGLRDFLGHWREQGARIGQRRGDVIAWEDGRTESIPPSETRYQDTPEPSEEPPPSTKPSKPNPPEENPPDNFSAEKERKRVERSAKTRATKARAPMLAQRAAERLARSNPSDLDVSILLGDLLANQATKWIAFDVEGDRDTPSWIYVSRALLRRVAVEVKRNPRMRNVRASLDQKGLHFRWGDRGGLNLIGQFLAPADRIDCLTVVFGTRSEAAA